MFLGFVILASGAWLLDAAVKNRHPLTTLRDIVKSPADYQKTLTNTTGTAFRTTAYVPSIVTGGAVGTAGATGSGLGAAALAWAQQQLGKPYEWGKTGPATFDCSGLVQQAYASVGIKLPRTSYQMMTSGVRVSRDQLQPGDLVWPDIGHVQLYAGNGMVTEAPHTGAVVRTVPMYGFLMARRVTGATA